MPETVAAERYPIPPEELRRRVGEPDADAFVRSGNADVRLLDEQALGHDGKSLKDFASILDFGCGCGRLTRALRPRADAWATLQGADTDAGSIRWCKDNIGDASFWTVGETPPLHFTDASMDLIIAWSVFTHLDVENQFHWLNEFQRVLKPGGYLLATFRYTHFIDRSGDGSLRERTWTKLSRDGVTFLPAGSITAGVRSGPSGDSFHSPEYIRKNWGSYFEVRQIVTAETDAQEVAVLRARESTFLKRVFQRA